MLLFVRNPYYRDIREGRKRFELRAGARYRNVRPGDRLSINGQFDRIVTRVLRFESIDNAALATAAAGYHVSQRAIADCYPNGGPYYIFHF